MKIKIFSLLTLLSIVVTSCLRDDTTLGTGLISQILIDSTSIAPEYNIDKNDTLVIRPMVEQTNEQKSLRYHWEMNLHEIADTEVFTFVGSDLGSFPCRLIVENEDGRSFYAFTIHVNTPYEQGLTVISNDANGKSHLAFMLFPPDGSAPQGFRPEECFSVNNPDYTFASHVIDLVQSTDNLILTCQGSEADKELPTIYYLNEKTFVLENVVTAPEFPDFKPTHMVIPSQAYQGIAYPIICEDGKIFEFSSTEGAIIRPVKLPYTYAQTHVAYDLGTSSGYQLLFWEKELGNVCMIYNGYGPYYCSKKYNLERNSFIEECKKDPATNYFQNRNLVKMVLIRMTHEQSFTNSSETLFLTVNNGMYNKVRILTSFWKTNFDTMENVLGTSDFDIADIGSTPIDENTPCVANYTYKSLLFGDGNKVRRWNYTTSQFVSDATTLVQVGTEKAVITALELSADHKETYVAFYEPDQEGKNGSVWTIDTDKGTVLHKYDHVCYQPVKMIYKKK